MTLALIIIGIAIVTLWLFMIIDDGNNNGLLLIPTFILSSLFVIIPDSYKDMKQDFLEGRYIKQYTYIDSIKVDSTYVLKEDIFKHK